MRRRADQLGSRDTAALGREIHERDRRDRERKSSPLLVADGAVVVDTSDQSVEDSLEMILGMLERPPKSR